MDPIGNLLTAAAPAPSVRPASSGSSAPILPHAPDTSSSSGDAVVLTGAAQQVYQSAPKSSGPIANSEILGTNSVAIFKDATGQICSRIWDRSTGKVTYLPEPQMASSGSSGHSMSLIA